MQDGGGDGGHTPETTRIVVVSDSARLWPWIYGCMLASAGGRAGGYVREEEEEGSRSRSRANLEVLWLVLARSVNRSGGGGEHAR